MVSRWSVWIDEFVPMVCGRSMARGGMFSHFPFAADAKSGVGKSVQPGDRNLVLADRTDPVVALLQTLDRPFDLLKLARFDFGKLRSQFLTAAVKGGIGAITGQRGRT